MLCEIYMQMEIKKLRHTGFVTAKKFRWCVALLCCPPIDLLTLVSIRMSDMSFS